VDQFVWKAFALVEPDASFTLTSRRSLLATRADAVASRDAQEGPLAGLAYPFTASRV
jgi:hypothetical protein